ncbi:ABC transporter ATP-binding protein [Solirubrobacter soli]|uniref:ABC transporter ATP-binding protein n=1 Tax=Solirubrobacter soli TaxID=363832 RepID=UPI00041F374F|nr:ABC transporter ATP-binding protein [Solirubrobacter soli]
MLDTNPFVARLGDVTKTYGRGPGAVRALQGVSLDFTADTFTAIMGPSGSGKSTLLQLAAGLETPSSGTVELAGRPLAGLGETELTELRRDRIGFVFQNFNLLPTLTVAQNVELPVRLAGRRPARGSVAELLERVGLGGRAKHRPFELSGGERQRVAIARALITAPAVTFADEPTGALDLHVAGEVLELLREVCPTVVMVTHDPVAASYAQRVVFLADGRIADELHAPTADRVAEILTEPRACPA